MTKARRPYSRVYWEVIDDPKFQHVWDDDRALATWLRLLVAADMAWPASATLPYNVSAKAVAVLVGAGLVDRQSGGRYRIHGLDRERNARSRQASDAASARWDDDEPPHPAGNAGGMRPHPPSNPPRMPSQDEPSKAEQSRDEASRARARQGGDVWDVTHLISELTGYTPSPKVTEDIRADVANLGAERVLRAVREARDASDRIHDASTLWYAAHKILIPFDEPERLSPKEKREREIAEIVERTKREAAAAQAGRA